MPRPGAAELAGLPKPEFLAAKLADYGVDNFGQSSADLADEAANV